MSLVEFRPGVFARVGETVAIDGLLFTFRAGEVYVDEGGGGRVPGSWRCRADVVDWPDELLEFPVRPGR